MFYLANEVIEVYGDQFGNIPVVFYNQNLSHGVVFQVNYMKKYHEFVTAITISLKGR